MLVYSDAEIKAAIKQVVSLIESCRRIALTEVDADTRRRYEERTVQLMTRLAELQSMIEVTK